MRPKILQVQLDDSLARRTGLQTGRVAKSSKVWAVEQAESRHEVTSV